MSAYSEIMAVLDLGEIRRKVEKATVYSDFIAHVCAVALTRPHEQRIVAEVGPVRHDLHPTGGYLLSDQKTIMVTDRNGRRYRVTVEEVCQ